MTLAPDPHWQSLLAASDSEEAWTEMEARRDRRAEWAPASAAEPAGRPTGPVVVEPGSGQRVPALSASARADGHPRNEPEPNRPGPPNGTDPAEVSPSLASAGEPCPTCDGEMVVPVGPRDFFGQQATTDCPDCAYPVNDEAPRAADIGRGA